MNEKAIKILRFCYSAVLLIERYYSMLEKILRFETLHEAKILMFGVSNAKNLAFGTHDANALTILRLKVCQCSYNSKAKSLELFSFYTKVRDPAL